MITRHAQRDDPADDVVLAAAATAAGAEAEVQPAAVVLEQLLLEVQREVAAEQVQRPCAMFTTRIRPKISVKPLATTK